jgi:hypothetical protein
MEKAMLQFKDPDQVALVVACGAIKQKFSPQLAAAAADYDAECKVHEAAIDEIKALIDRRCGSCSLCCKVTSVAVLNKPAGQWCSHANPGHGGCGIYQSRPSTCRGFACQWLIDPSYPEEMKPDRSKLVFHMVNAAEGVTPKMILKVYVDPSHPGHWRKEPYYSTIKNISGNGLRYKQWLTRIFDGPKKWLILPDMDVEDDGTGLLFLD